MKLFRITLLSLFFASFSDASATALAQLALSEISFTTESGYSVKVTSDFDGRITSLTMSKKGTALLIPAEAYKDISGAALHEISLVEDPYAQYIKLRIPAYSYSKESGNAETKDVHSLVFSDLKYDALESNVKSVPVNRKDCSQ